MNGNIPPEELAELMESWLASPTIAPLVSDWIDADAIERQDDINCEIDIFDEMTRQGAKLNLITGEYEFPSASGQSQNR